MKHYLALVFVLFAFGLKAGEEFTRKIRPFLNTYCISCHGPEVQKGKIRFDQLTASMSDRNQAELWMRMLETIEFGEMPPDSAKKFPTKAEARLVQGWISRALEAQGLAVEEKRDKEGYGNLVSHELLFSKAESKRTIDVAARLWRITPKALANLLRGARMVSNPFDLEKPHGNFRDFKGKYHFNSLMAEQITELAIAHSDKEAKNARKMIVALRGKGSTLDEANQEAIKRHYNTVLRRAPAEKEMESLMALLKKVDAELGIPRGLQAAFAAIILQPETLFRFEGLGGSNKEGLTKLTRRELAIALAFALTYLPSDSHLLNVFKNEKLSVQLIIQQKAQRLLDDQKRPEAKSDFCSSFRNILITKRLPTFSRTRLRVTSTGPRHWCMTWMR